MQHLEVSGAVRPLKWSLSVKWLIKGDLGALMAMHMDVMVFCDVMSCSPVFM